MNKREFKVRVKEIIDAIDESIKYIEENSKPMLDEAKEKLDDLEEYLDYHCINPDGFDSEEVFQSILEDYFENENEILNIIGDIENLRIDIEEHISDMPEGDKREQWEELEYEISSMEDILDIQNNNIEDVDGFIDNLCELKNQLFDLI